MGRGGSWEVWQAFGEGNEIVDGRIARKNLGEKGQAQGRSRKKGLETGRRGKFGVCTAERGKLDTERNGIWPI